MADNINNANWLKEQYLKCEQEATSQRMSSDDVYLCVEIYQQLLTEVFDGNYSALYSWYKSQPSNNI
jgi:hypothetical protein